MFRKMNLTVALLAMLLVMATNTSSQTSGCNCANASLIGDTVGTRVVGWPLVNSTVNSGVELPNAGPTLGAPGPSPRWNIDFGSNTIRIDFVQQPATYGMGSYFTFSSLDPRLAGCPPAFISGITVTTNKPTAQFNVAGAATFGPNTVTIQIAPSSKNIDWQAGEFILVKLNFACDTKAQQCSDLNGATGHPGWMLASGPGISAPKIPVNVSPFPGWQNPPLPGSSWISVDANRGNLPGDYTYVFPFCVCNEGKHLLSLSFYADNGAKVFLNNTQIFATTGVNNFSGAPKTVSHSWASGPGQNILRIVVSNQGSVTGLNASFKITGANNCCQIPKSSLGSVLGRVVDPKNSPRSGVEVLVPGRAAVLTNSKGEFEIGDLEPTERLAVSFSAPGFMNTTKIFRVGESAGNGNTVVIWPRAAAVPLDAARGGRVSFPRGGGVTIAPNSLVYENGRTVRGKVMVSLTQLDVSDRAQLSAMAGDFKAQMADKSIRMLESFGVFELIVTDGEGQRLNLGRGNKANFDLPIRPVPGARLPRRTGLFSFDTAAGLWIEHGQVALTEPLVYSGTIDNFDGSLWNTDNPLEVTCITVKFIDVFGSNQGPIAGATVTATGVNYNAISTGTTNGDGLVCLLVKINSWITINAYDPLYPNSPPIGPLNVMSPNIISNGSDCGDPTLCPLVITVEQDARLLTPAPNKTITVQSLYPRTYNPKSQPKAAPVSWSSDRLVSHQQRRRTS